MRICCWSLYLGPAQFLHYSRLKTNKQKKNRPMRIGAADERNIGSRLKHSSNTWDTLFENVQLPQNSKEMCNQTGQNGTERVF